MTSCISSLKTSPLMVWSCCLLLTAGLARAAEPEVRLEKKEDTVVVSVGGKPFTTYNFSHQLPKPFFSPVLSADGAVITRGLELEKKDDHPHHKGIWVAIDEVNGIKFWAEKGKIENASVELLTPAGNPAVMRVVNHWLGEDGQPVLIETTDISIDADRLLSYDIQLKAGKQPVTIGDTKEGLFGIRVANTLRENEGGKVVNAEGLQGTKECWGKESDWVDYVGPVGGKTYGVAIFDHPLNARRSRYHVRNYGLFTISPFGTASYTGGKQPADELIIPVGGSYRLRYGLYLHDGDTAEGRVAQTYLRYVGKAK